MQVVVNEAYRRLTTSIVKDRIVFYFQVCTPQLKLNKLKENNTLIIRYMILFRLDRQQICIS